MNHFIQTLSSLGRQAIRPAKEISVLACFCGLRWAFPVLAAMALVACVNLSGLDGSSQYGCQAPAGVKCESVSGTYYNSLKNNLPSQRANGAQKASPKVAPPAAPGLSSRVTRVRFAVAEGGRGQADPAGLSSTLSEPVPLRSQGRVLGMWVKPWKDADGDLFDEGRVYVQVDSGDWMIEHVRQRIRDAYAPVRAPKSAQGTREPSSGSSARQATPALLPGRSIIDAAKLKRAADKVDVDDPVDQ